MKTFIDYLPEALLCVCNNVKEPKNTNKQFQKKAYYYRNYSQPSDASFHIPKPEKITCGRTNFK